MTKRRLAAIVVLSIFVHAGAAAAQVAGQGPATSPPTGPQATLEEGPEDSQDAQEGDAPDWPGSFGVDGLNTRFAIGGFAQLDVIHDTDAIGADCQFITSTIVTRNPTKADGADGKTNFCVGQSRLWFETRTPTSFGRVRTYIEIDFFGDALGTTPEPRLRQAYGEVTGVLFGGDLLAGQTWSTFTDVGAWPDILDFEGPSNAIVVRQPMVRWTRSVSTNTAVQLAAETPGAHNMVGADGNDVDSLTRWPDFVAVTKWSPGGAQLNGAAILRDLRASADDGPTASTLGWGFSGSGKVPLPFLSAEDNLTFQFSYGEGIAGYFADAAPDAVLNTTDSRLERIPRRGGYVSYEHFWTSQVSSTLVAGRTVVSNLDIQPDDALRTSAYFSLNLLWRPISSVLFGGEFMRGWREDKDGAWGDDNRVQISGRVSF